MQKNNVTFRRIHGRIIPIAAAQKSDFKKGLSLVTAGLATSAASGFGHHKLLKAASQMRGQARAGTKLYAKALRLGGIGAGTAIISYGIHKLYKSYKKPTPAEGAVTTGAVAAHGAFMTGAYGLPGAAVAAGEIAEKIPTIRRKKS